MITLLTFTLTLPFLLILYIAFSLFLKPIVKINFYRKQGCDMKFFPLMGTFKKCFDSLASQDDFHGYFKTEVQKNPKVRVLGGNLIDKAQLFLVDHELIKEFFQQQDKYYKSPQVTDMLKVFMGNGLAAAEGPIWKRHRKILGSAFHFELLKEMIPEVIKIAEEIFNKQTDLTEINVTQIFEAITGEVVGRLFFGAEFSQYKIRGMPVTTFLSSVVNRVESELSSPSYMIFGVKGVRARVLKKYAVIMDDVKELQDFARTIIEKKQAERAARLLQDGEKKTFIDILLDSRDKTADEVFSVQDTIDEFITFFAGGMDTTGHLLGMATYYLHQNPENKAKLMAEVDKYFADPSTVGLDDLNKMEFMTAFIKETLRMSTPAPIITDRVASEDHCLKDLKVKKGTLINVSQMANNFHPEYHEDPYNFKPERWLEGGKTREMISKNPYAFIPFSAGAHNCIGQHLAMNEARAIFSIFLKKFDFELTPNYKLKMRMGLLYEPVDKLNFKLVPKHC